MTEFGIWLAIVLMGPVVYEPTVAASGTTDGRIAYVTKRDCILGQGMLSLSDTKGNGSALSAPFNLQGTSPVSVAAATICNHWSN